MERQENDGCCEGCEVLDAKTAKTQLRKNDFPLNFWGFAGISDSQTVCEKNLSNPQWDGDPKGSHLGTG